MSPPRWLIVPTGAGEPRLLPPAPFIGLGEANFLPDGRRIVFGATEKGARPRIYVQNVDGGSLRAVSPVGAGAPGEFGTGALLTPDGRFVLGWSNDSREYVLYPVDGGEPCPLRVLSATDGPLQWSPDGRVLYSRRRDTWPPVVERVNVETGQRQRWKTVFPADPVGVDSIFRILITPDGKSYCHDYWRFTSELFIVEGLG
jgi:hypothetical protein